MATPAAPPEATLATLPADLLGHIVLALDGGASVGRALQVNRPLAELGRTAPLWRALLDGRKWRLRWDAGLTDRECYVMVARMHALHRHQLLALHRGSTSIGGKAFDGCAALALRRLPPRTAEIGICAFRGCTALALTELPAAVETLRMGVFDGCASLALTQLPPAVACICSAAFRGCEALAVRELPRTVVVVGTDAFEGCAQRPVVHDDAIVANPW